MKHSFLSRALSAILTVILLFSMNVLLCTAASSELSQTTVAPPIEPNTIDRMVYSAIPEGVYRIRNVADGRYLTLYQENPGQWYATLMYSSSESFDNQLWKITGVGSYYHEIRSVCLDNGEDKVPYCINSHHGSYSTYARAFDVSPYDTQYGYPEAEPFIWYFSPTQSYSGVDCYTIASGLTTSTLMGPYGSTSDYHAIVCMDAYGEDYEKWVLEPFRVEAAVELRNEDYWVCSAPTDTFRIHCSGTEAQTTYFALFQQAVSSWNTSFAETSITLLPNNSTLTPIAECSIVHRGPRWKRGETSLDSWTNHDIVSATVVINVDDALFFENDVLDLTRVKGTIAHEIGHLLGLKDNPANASGPDASLMNHYRNLTEISYPQELDTHNVYRLYGPY